MRRSEWGPKNTGQRRGEEGSDQSSQGGLNRLILLFCLGADLISPKISLAQLPKPELVTESLDPPRRKQPAKDIMDLTSVLATE